MKYCEECRQLLNDNDACTCGSANLKDVNPQSGVKVANVKGGIRAIVEPAFKEKGIPYGFGGIASLGKGMLPAEKVIAEHYRLGSTCAILSRSFCNLNTVVDVEEVRSIFSKGLKEIRDYESECANGKVDLIENRKDIGIIVNKILENIG